MDGKEHPLGVELGDILSQLELDDYAVELEESGQGKRRLLFEQIKEELRFPYLDLRLPLAPVSSNDMFFLLTGETDQSLYVGLKVGGTVTEISDSSFQDEQSGQYKRRQRAVVQTDAGLRGYISAFDLFDERVDVENLNLSDILQRGQHIQAVVVGVRKERLQLDLSIKPSLLSKNESWWLENRDEERKAREWWESRGINTHTLFDTYFLESQALRAAAAEEDALRKSSESINQQLTAASLSGARAGGAPTSAASSSGRSVMRVVHHPLFANLDFKAAEERLRVEGKGAGEVLIRPSSKGPNYLTITWAFQNNWFKHISVEERGKRAGDLGLGTQLYVQEDDMTEPYNDLDELFSRYIEPMNDLVSVMLKHRSFMSGSETEVNAMMFARRLESPQRIPYFFRFEGTKPGVFTLTWLSLNIKSENPVKNLRVEVRPHVSASCVVAHVLLRFYYVCFHCASIYFHICVHCLLIRNDAILSMQGLRAQGELFPRPSDLIVWFKETQEAQVAAQVAASAAAKHKGRPSTGAGSGVSNSGISNHSSVSVAPVAADAPRKSRWGTS